MVNDWGRFKKFQEHWIKKGFGDADCEFLVCNNAQGNQFDGFQAGRLFLEEAKGRYIIYVHLDSRPLETKKSILNIIRKLDSKDPKWALMGNAGVHQKTGEGIILGLRMPGCAAPRHKAQFIPVQALDENLLIIKADARLTFSHDLYGYHFYGLDICDLARRIGRTIYVARLNWYHASHGTLNSDFHCAKQRVESKMIQYHGPRIWGTNCAYLSFSSWPWMRAWAKACTCWILRNNEHHTAEERRTAWDAGRKELFFYPAYILLWLFKKTGLEKRRNRRTFKRESLWPLYG